MLSARTLQMLESRHVPFEVLSHDLSYTAHGTASVAHVPERQFAKVVVVQARPDRPLMVVLPASCHLDLEAVAEVAGEGPLALVPEQDLVALFPDCEVGAMPPFGSLYGMPVFLSACLGRAERLYFNGGSHRETLSLRTTDFERLTKPKVAEVCKGH